MKEKRKEKLQMGTGLCSKGDLCLCVFFLFFIFVGMFFFNSQSLKMYYVDLNGLINRLFGQKYLNEVVLLENGHLILPEEERTAESIEKNAENLESFRVFAESIGAELLYVSVPAKNVLHDEELPAGVNDFAVQNLNYFMECLGETEVEYIDIRLLLEQNEESSLNYYYLSDHHWKISYGLEVAGYLAQYFNEEMGMNCDLSLLMAENFETVVYDELHLGSHGRRVGRYFGPGADDFEYIYPSYETLFADYTFMQEGDFRSILTGEGRLTERSHHWRDAYDMLYSRMMNCHIDNLLNENGPRVYVISDSMGHAVFPFLSLVCDEVYWGDVNEEEIREFQPDIIIFMRLSTTLI